MKKFLTSALKIGVGVFIGFILLVVAVAIISPDSGTDNTATQVEPATPVENTASSAGEETDAKAEVTPEEEKPTSLDDAKVQEDESSPKKSEDNEDVDASYQEKLKEQETEDEEAESSGNEVDAPTEEKKTGGVYDIITWDYYKTGNIGDFNKAPAGKNYYVVNIHFDNTGSDTYSTNAFFWKLNADGVSYTTDVATYNLPDYKLVDVGPGGKVDASLAFLVDGEPQNIELEYVGL